MCQVLTEIIYVYNFSANAVRHQVWAMSLLYVSPKYWEVLNIYSFYFVVLERGSHRPLGMIYNHVNRWVHGQTGRPACCLTSHDYTETPVSGFREIKRWKPLSFSISEVWWYLAHSRSLLWWLYWLPHSSTRPIARYKPGSSIVVSPEQCLTPCKHQ